MISHLTNVTLSVTDQQAAVMFYEEKLGFRVRLRHPLGDGEWIEMVPPGARCAIALVKREPLAQAPNGVVVTLACGDIEETCERLAERGVVFVKPLTRMDWGRFAVIRDPDGNQLGLRQDDETAE